MGYLLKAGIGLTLFFGAIVVFNIKLVEVLQIGTCASGGPYEISRPCPPGTGTDVALLVGSIFAGLIGCAVFAFRGEAPWAKGRRRTTYSAFGLGSFAWAIFFTSTGVVMLIEGFGNDSLGADSELGGKIVGFTFLAMGLPVLIFATLSLVKSFIGSRGRREERPQMSRDVTAAAAPIGRLERLDKLRKSGAINDAEFEREKSKILAE